MFVYVMSTFASQSNRNESSFNQINLIDEDSFQRKFDEMAGHGLQIGFSSAAVKQFD